MKKYTVIGLLALDDDQHQRWANTYEAANPDEAERLAVAHHRGDTGMDCLLIAAVIEGTHACADTERTYGEEHG